MSKMLKGFVLMSMMTSFSVWAADGSLLEKANTAENQKHFDVALSLYQDALSSPENTEAATLGIARSKAGLGQFADAETVLKKYIAENPFSVEARLTHAEVYRNSNHFDAAVKELRVVDQLQPGSVAATEQRGYIFFDQGAFDKAIEPLTTVVNATPAANLPRLRRAQAYMELGKYTEAVHDFSVLVEAVPSNVRVEVALGEAYVKAKDLKKAEETYKFVLTIDPQSAEVMEKIGDLRVEQKMNVEAIASYKQCIETSPDRFTAGQKLADTYIAVKQVKDAETEYARELKVDPTYAPAAQKIVEIWTAQNKFSQAGRFLDQYAAKNPTQGWASVAYSKLLMKIGQDDAAEARLEKVRKETDKSAEVAMLLAHLKAKRGAKTEALDVLLTAERNTTDNFALKYDIAVMHDNMGHTDQAISKYKEIPSTAASYYKSQINLAVLYEAKKQYGAAIASLKAVRGAGEQASSVEMKIAELERAQTGTTEGKRGIASVPAAAPAVEPAVEKDE